MSVGGLFQIPASWDDQAEEKPPLPDAIARPPGVRAFVIQVRLYTHPPRGGRLRAEEVVHQTSRPPEWQTGQELEGSNGVAPWWGEAVPGGESPDTLAGTSCGEAKGDALEGVDNLSVAAELVSVWVRMTVPACVVVLLRGETPGEGSLQ